MLLKVLSTLLATTILFVGMVPLHGQEPAQIDLKVGATADAVIEELLRRQKEGLNCAVIVEKGGKVVLKAGFGWANQAERIPFSTSTIAQVGSLTKQFTATAIVDLSVQNRLRFSDPITKYLKGVPPEAAEITIHELLSHTAGLPESCGGDFDRLSRSEMISRCLTMAGRPGKFLYSNLGYSVLAAVVESVTHKQIEVYLVERFFKPLRMNSSGYTFPSTIRRRFAMGYTSAGTVPPISDRLQKLGGDYWNIKGNGGIQASTDDMYVWFRALTKGPIITGAIRKALMTPVVSRDEEVKYGYGWFLRTNAQGQVEQVSHSGSDGVFLAAFVWRPLDGVFFYFVTNNRDKGGAETASTILRIIRDHKTTKDR